MEYKYSDITGQIIKACLAVYNTLGSGFPEVIYQRALEIEMDFLGLDFIREAGVKVYYREKLVGDRRVDFLVADKIPVELKAVSRLDNAHLNQGINYLEAYNFEVGLLINFGGASLEWKRLYNTKFKTQ